MDFQNLNVRLLIEPIDYPTDGKDEVKGKLDDKTPSQRLRAVLFVLYTQEGSPGNFVDFYRTKVEHFIESIKSQLKQE